MSEQAITLLPVEREDLDFLADLANDPVVRSGVVGWGWPVAKSGQMAWYQRTLDDQNSRRFLVRDASGRRIGLAELVDVDFSNRIAEVGIKLGASPGVRGHGYGQMTLQALCEFAFGDIGLCKLTATILSDNVASLRLFSEKCGWSVEGVLRSQVLHRGERKDLVQLGLLREEFYA